MSKNDSVEEDSTKPVGDLGADTDPSPERRRLRYYRALRDAGYSDLTIISREDVIDHFNHRHFAIIDYLRENNADSVRGLARELEFDKKNVSEDLKLLARLEVVAFDESGRSKSPRLKKDHIFVEPLA
ncbi:transcriptional regulator [Halorubrum sp. GN11_10-6_MGM]|uniref:HVO_A0114 family putative DNA-binding protein n=1 Tax=Halorubrum sp. GN11_10-6_MGM TaxID=2518112 RepID=UPI0010F9A259|nr:transcriptional regulator [Halorubrum sp. GN11_10-6_MGM]TKX73971.1 transcriptional regulator [Halorubrum sp. GN11_10-6_MGM]